MITVKNQNKRIILTFIIENMAFSCSKLVGDTIMYTSLFGALTLFQPVVLLVLSVLYIQSLIAFINMCILSYNKNT